MNRNSVFSVNYIHNDLLQTIEDLGALDAQGNEIYIIGNPGAVWASTPRRPA
jgi:hypothetical protein